MTLVAAFFNTPFLLSSPTVLAQTKNSSLMAKSTMFSNYLTKTYRNTLTDTTQNISHIHVSGPGNGWTIVQSWQQSNQSAKFSQIFAASSDNGGRNYSNPFPVSNANTSSARCIDPDQAATINEVYIIFLCNVASAHTHLFVTVSKNYGLPGTFSTPADLNFDPNADSSQASIQAFPDTKVIATWTETGTQHIRTYCWRC